MPAPHPLDNPVLSSLAGPHARFAQRQGNVLRYLPGVSPFAGMPAAPDTADWTDAATLAGPGRVLALAADPPAPAGWHTDLRLEGVQMTGEAMTGQADPEAVLLGPADMPEMLSLAERTKPGPFLRRTNEMGAYLGIRRDGALVAMAGERLHPAGWTEVSAVCTDPAWRGHGLASRLVLASVAGIQARGEAPFLHAVTSNVNAIRLYGELGFKIRRPIVFSVLRVPGAEAA